METVQQDELASFIPLELYDVLALPETEIKIVASKPFFISTSVWG